MTSLTKLNASDLDRMFDTISKYSVGYEPMLSRLYQHTEAETYPPYKIVKESNEKWRVEMALAGWKKEDFEVTTETNILTVKSVDGHPEDNSVDYAHRGVAARQFNRSFNLSDDVEVGDVRYDNGLLTIDLQKVIPDLQKRKIYEIT